MTHPDSLGARLNLVTAKEARSRTPTSSESLELEVLPGAEDFKLLLVLSSPHRLMRLLPSWA